MLHRPLAHGALFLLVSSLLAAPSGAQCLETLTARRAQLAATALGTRAFFAGGEGVGSSSLVEIHDAALGSWSSAQLSEARSQLAALSVPGKALFAGGGRPTLNFQFQASARVDLFDGATDTWLSARLSLARWALAAAAVGHHGLFAGGLLGGAPPHAPSAAVDLYDAASGAWSVAELSQARGALAATSVGSVALFAGGACAPGAGCVGGDQDTLGFSAVVDLYDALTGTWATASLSQARSGLAATSVGHLALFAGGWSASGPSGVVDIYDASSGTWRVAFLSRARANLVAFTVGTFAVFAGGHDGLFASDAVDLYDLATDRWTSTRLALAREAAAAAVLGGQALIAGGRGNEPGLAGVYDHAERLGAALAVPFAFGLQGCPCGNAGDGFGGCAGSSGAGAMLRLGCAPSAPGTLALVATRLAPAQQALLLAATASTAQTPFGDGLLVLGGALERSGSSTADATGVASWPLAGFPPSRPRNLQVWHRDPGSPCGGGANLSNALLLLPW